LTGAVCTPTFATNTQRFAFFAGFAFAAALAFRLVPVAILSPIIVANGQTRPLLNRLLHEEVTTDEFNVRR
jgi:mannose/fructose/N-acetylgalactosamine-specific phosphotransferase system component IIC